MAQIYRVCSGNTAIDITCTFTKSACVFWYDVYQNYYTNTFYKQTLTVTLSQQSPVPFTYNYGVGWTTTKNGDPYASGYSSYTVTIPANVSSYSWDVTCSSDIGQANYDGGNNQGDIPVAQ